MAFMDLHHFEKLDSYLPVDLTIGTNLILAFGVTLFFVLFRYFAMVLPLQGLFYWWRPNWTRARQIYPRLPGLKEQLFELKWSLISSLVFAITGVFMAVAWQRGWTLIYVDFGQYGWWYLPFSWLVLLIVHDAYFYWVHRWLHWPGIFERYHLIHHKSLRPSGWASFSFHPVESFLNAIVIPLIVFVLPLHPVVILFHLTLMTISAITNHIGFEVLPAFAVRWGLGNWLISGVHHTMHHRNFRSNYGLFLGYWDHWLKTENPQFENEIQQIFTKVSRPSEILDS